MNSDINIGDKATETPPRQRQESPPTVARSTQSHSPSAVLNQSSYSTSSPSPTLSSLASLIELQASNVIMNSSDYDHRRHNHEEGDSYYSSNPYATPYFCPFLSSSSLPSSTGDCSHRDVLQILEEVMEEINGMDDLFATSTPTN